MAAAGWTVCATDITTRRDVWGDYLDIGQLINEIGLAEATIRNALTRTWSAQDPNSAIRWPAARIGGSPAGVGAEPMWAPEQAREYRRLTVERERAREQEIEDDRNLPVISAGEAVERGLCTVRELTELLDRPRSTLARWMRESRGSDRPFPAKLGQAERVAPITNMGPPRPLYSLAAVQQWVRETEEYEVRYGGGRGRRRRDIPEPV